jgi:methylated-DNA-protein-cysteine methyltransferase-like protein
MPANKDNNDFFQRVYRIVETIPYGKVTSYGAIGKALGLRSSARMVGWALNALAGSNSHIPAHRVVNRLGELSGKFYFGTPNLMRELLESEGIEFIDDAVDMKKHFWEPLEEV